MKQIENAFSLFIFFHFRFETKAGLLRTLSQADISSPWEGLNPHQLRPPIIRYNLS